MRNVIRSFSEALLMIFKHRYLTLELAKKDYIERYHGQILGMVWAFAHPLVLMAIYTYVFTYVAKVRMNPSQMPMDYSIYILGGLIPWMAFSELLSRSTSVLRSNTSMIKQVIFPVEVLPLVSVMVVFLSELIFFGLFFLLLIANGEHLSPMLAFLPVAIVLQLIGMAGVSFLLSSISVYMKDIKEVIQVVSMGVIYLMPIFYLPDSVPSQFKFLVDFNPLSAGVFVFQDIFYFGHFQHPNAWILFSLFNLIFFVLGFSFFKKVKIYFGSLL